MSITAGESPISTPLTLFLIQMIVVVVLCRTLSYLFKYIKQPSVIAEVVTGIILGPSVFGYIPKYMKTLFPPTSLPIFNVIANVGLILFMFMVGLEIDTKLMKKNVGSAIMISLTAMILPFLLGLGSAYVVYITAIDPSVSFASFLLFVGVALSITAFPVLARILTELKMLDSRVGNIALSSAAVDDVIAWCLLALVVSIARAKHALDALWTFLLLLGFIAFMMLVVRPFLASVAKRKSDSHVSVQTVMFFLVGAFICAWFTEIIGVHAIFGSFILGTITPRRNRYAAALIERIEDLVVIIFLPLYFTYSGLRTNIGTLKNGSSWGLVILIITTACVGKITGATITSRFLKCSWRESFSIGILMNTKGLVELIVLNVGLDVGVLNTEVFTIFVIMALVTTFMTTPLIYLVYIRHAEKMAKEAQEGLFKTFLVATDLKIVPWMMSIGSIFLHAKEQLTLKVLMLNEISDRPSSYFFSEYYYMIQDIAFTKDGKKRKFLLEDVKQAAKDKGMQVESKSIASANLPRDVASYANSHNCDFLLFELPLAVENSNEKRESINLTQSIDIAITKVMKLAPSTNVEYSVNNCTSAMGVVLHSKTSTERIERVLFAYSQKPHEAFAFSTVASMSKHLDVSILAASEAIDLPASSTAKVTVCADPEKEALSMAEKGGYDLLIISLPRKLPIPSQFESTSIPILLMFPPKQSSFNMEVSDV